MQVAVEGNNLSIVHSNGFRALDRLSFRLPAGKITGFIGPSGAGKTTLIRALVGRQKLTDGSLSVLGLPAGSAKLRGQFSYMTQSLSVYPDLTIRENLGYFAQVLGIKKKEMGEAVREVIRLVDLTSQVDRIAGTLSGGQKQRVSLGVALLGDPQLLCLDEPTVGLDPVLREALWGIFRGLAASGKTVIITSHAMDEADRCDDLLLIRDGSLLAHAPPRDLCQQTQSETVEESFIKLVEGDR